MTTQEMDEMTIGDCLDFIQEYVSESKKKDGTKTNVRKAVQADFDSF